MKERMKEEIKTHLTVEIRTRDLLIRRLMRFHLSLLFIVIVIFKTFSAQICIKLAATARWDIFSLSVGSH